MCVYNKKNMCIYVCVYGVVLINILVLQLGPPKQKFLAPPLETMTWVDNSGHSSGFLVIGKLTHCS